MKRLTSWVVMIAGSCFLLHSCNSDSERVAGVSSMRYENIPRVTIDPVDAGQSGGIPPGARLSQSSGADQQERKIVKSARINAEVRSAQGWVDFVRDTLAQRHQSMIIKTHRRGYTGAEDGHMVLSVPAARLDRTLESIRAFVLRIEWEGIEAEDISERYYDVVARLENFRKSERRIREILSKARTVTEVLDVERELARVRTDIELLESQYNRMEENIRRSTITIDWHEPRPLAKGKEDGLWHSISTGFSQGMFGFMLVIQTTMTVVIAGFPVLAPLGYLIWQFMQRRRKKLEAEPTE